jgi:hypothetical protein
MTLTSPRFRGRSPTTYSHATNAAANQHRRGRTKNATSSTSSLANVDENDDMDQDDYSSDECELMDEDDQNALVQSYHAQAAAQSQFFQKVFGYGIGGLAMVLSLALPVLCPEECAVLGARSCWGHAVYACVVHAWSVHPFLFRPPQTPAPSIDDKAALLALSTNNDPGYFVVVGMTLQLIPLIMWLAGFFNHDEDHFHLGLMIGDVVTFGGAWLIRWDMQSTDRLLLDLNNAKYEHKSL